MFDLENAIRQWRRDFERRRAFQARDLDELEAHLRDHVEWIRAEEGVSEEEAFRRAAKAVGDYGTAEEEYDKVYWEKARARQGVRLATQMQLAMFKNYVIVALRHLRRRPVFSLLNVSGLAIGLAACLLVGLFIADELSFDQFHQNADRIYRVNTIVHAPDGEQGPSSTNGWGVARTLAADYPEIAAVVEARNAQSYSFKHDGRYYRERAYFASGNFFDVFSFPLLAGNPATALEAPYTLVLSEELAEKYFANAPDALGQTLMLNDSLAFTVTGVTRVPRNSHLQFDALLSFSTYTTRNPNILTEGGWFNLQHVNYVLLRPGVDAAALGEKVRGLYDAKMGEWNGYRLSLALEPMADIYLRTEAGNGWGPSSDMKYVYLLGAIGLFLLLIACINFMNLATARSAERAREVGVRKVVGSSQAQLVRQFLAEAIVLALSGLVLGFVLFGLALPLFNELTGKTFGMAALFTPTVLLAALGLAVLVGALAGLYPAFVLAGHRPVAVLKGAFRRSRQGVWLRQGLVVFQFAISCVLIVATLVVVKQLGYMRAQDLGFDEEHVLLVNVFNADRTRFNDSYNSIKDELAALPSVQHVSSGASFPGNYGWNGQISFPEGPMQEEGISLEYIPVDFDYFDTVGLEVIAGRAFSEDFAETDVQTSVMINETAARAVGWDPMEAVGKRFDSPGSGRQTGIVVGVVKDYHHHGLQREITPIMYGVMPPWAFFDLAVRFAPGDVPQAVRQVEQVWAGRFPGYPFEYRFLDDAFDEQYRTEQRLTKIFGVFAGLAIFVACLGLFGLAAFTAQQRTKEIGVRKVMGATVPGLVGLLSKDFLKLVLVAFVVAAPVAYFLMQSWLADFAYRITLGPDVFFIAAMIALAIAFLTVSYQAWRAASANPVESLRYE